MAAVERWVPVVGYEGLYEVSSLGRVRSIDRMTEFSTRWGGVAQRFARGQMLQPVWSWTNRKYPDLGYYKVGLSANGSVEQVAVHQLVLAAFVGPCPHGCEGAHQDGDVANNSVRNLKWKTAKENSADRGRHGTQTHKSGCCPKDPYTGRFYRKAV